MIRKYVKNTIYVVIPKIDKKKDNLTSYYGLTKRIKKFDVNIVVI